jgi:hypothetical protein
MPPGYHRTLDSLFLGIKDKDATRNHSVETTLWSADTRKNPDI